MLIHMLFFIAQLTKVKIWLKTMFDSFGVYLDQILANKIFLIS